MDPARRRRLVLRLGAGVAAVVLCAAAAFGLRAVERHVDGILTARPLPQPRLRFPGVPAVLEGLADRDIQAAVEPLLAEPWTAPDLCRRMADAAAPVGWIKTLRGVRRLADGAIQIDCDYRTPAAIVAQRDGYVLVDDDQVRLPGVYAYHQSWIVISGVAEPPPPAGGVWLGEDLRAGLNLIASLRREPFTAQITAVLVDNYDGRLDPRRCHLEVATDRTGGRIRWGSAPGAEIEENSMAQKAAILRANFARTGRIDAHYAVIDISTFADRFTVPG